MFTEYLLTKCQNYKLVHIEKSLAHNHLKPLDLKV